MLPFVLPPPFGLEDNPVWDGQQFLIDGSSLSVLEYSENFAGWSDDLTALHEEASGDSHPIDIASRQDAIAEVKKCNPSSNTVIMEIGCSSGFLIRDLVKFFPGASVIGADVVKEPLYRLAQSMPGVPLLRFDLLKCPLPEGSVDILIMLNVLEHIEDDVSALKQAFQLLKPGGKLIVEVPAGPILYDSYDAELHHFRRYSAAELSGKLFIAGFEITRQTHLGFILFPAFAVVKFLNKCKKNKNKEMVVKNQASSTQGSAVIRVAMKIEVQLKKYFRLPFGIRVQQTAIKK